MSPRANSYDRQQARRKPQERDLYRSALKALVEKLDSIAADPQFQSMGIFAFIHGRQYTGPNWADELARAKAVQRDRAGRDRPS